MTSSLTAGFLIGAIISFFVIEQNRAFAWHGYEDAYRDYKAGKIETMAAKKIPRVWIEFNGPKKEE